jgi:hypothetical protein
VIDHKTITIESKPAAEGEKSRSFSVELLAWVVASSLWEMGSTPKERVLRPVFMALAGSASASRAFLANLQAGRTAREDRKGGLSFEVPRSAGFRYESFPRGEGCLTLVYLPPVFSWQPGTTEEGTISFVAMPPTAWVDAQAAMLGSALGSEAREAAVAAYFVAFLDARSPLPIANDLRFHLELFRAAREQLWCSSSSGCDSIPGVLYAEGVTSVGFEPPVLCDVAPLEFAEFLAQQTARLLPRQPRPEVLLHGPTRVRRSRRLLPHSSTAPVQLCLFGGI